MREVRKELLDEVLSRLDLTREIESNQILSVIEEVVFAYGREHCLSVSEKCRWKTELFHAIRGFDILEELLEDEEVTEIMINGYQNVFYERKGKLFLWEKQFSSDEQLRDVIQRMVAGANRLVNDSNPIADTRLPDGSRVNIVLPPVSLCGPAVTIRKFSGEPLTLSRLIELGALKEEWKEYLVEAVQKKKNIFISGGTGSGKTTFLNALAAYIPPDERLVTIEDAAELQIRGIKNLVSLEVRKASSEGCSAITVRDLIRTALRMRPSRIIVGEVRGAEALDMLQAMNTGHEGSLSTGHANSSEDMIRRLETMVTEGSDMPLYAIRRQIASAIDVFVHLRRRRDGSRGVAAISENGGWNGEEISLLPVFTETEEGE